VESDSASNKAHPSDAERSRALTQELHALKALTEKLHRRAPHGQPHALRALVAQREAVIENLKDILNLSPEGADTSALARAIAPLSADEKSRVHAAIAEIKAVNTQTELILRDRAENMAEEMQKLRAGRKLRTANRSWT